MALFLMAAVACGDATPNPDGGGILDAQTQDASIADGHSTDSLIADMFPDNYLSDDTSETTLPPELKRMSPGIAYHEHALDELEEGVALNQDDTVLLWLEHPTSEGLLGDTGLHAGRDLLEYRFFERHEHTFCWNETAEGSPHRMSLVDSDGNEVLTITEGEGCKKVTLEPGLYTKHFIHGGGDQEGELIFIHPEPVEPETPAEAFLRNSRGLYPRSSGPACQPVAVLTHGTIDQLQQGQIGITDTCSPYTNTRVWVYDQNCPNLFTGQDSPKISVRGVYTGPNTQAIVHRGAWYSGYSFVAADTGSNPVCPASQYFTFDFWTDPQYSIKIWTNDPTEPESMCKVQWVGRIDELPRPAPSEGEVWLFTNPGWNRTETNGDKPWAKMVFILNGPCYDLCLINASETITSAHVGPNTVMTVYLDPEYKGQNFPYQDEVVSFGVNDRLIESIYVESLAKYNQRTTLITTRNCNQCNLMGIRLPKGENLSGAQLVGANLTDARMIGVNLSNVNATGAIFRGANLAYANLTNSIFSNAVFEGDSFIGPANLSYAYMPNAKLDHAHLNGVTADYAQIYGGQATVLQATMVGIHLANSILSNMDFSQAAMKGATLTGANLISTNFLGADLTSANLINASIQGARFDGAVLYGADLQNAAYAFEPGLITVTRLGDDNTLQTVSVSFDATSLPPSTTNKDTYCPNGGKSEDNNVCDTVEELTAHSPPSPPECIPSATQFCPRPLSK